MLGLFSRIRVASVSSEAPEDLDRHDAMIYEGRKLGDSVFVEIVP